MEWKFINNTAYQVNENSEVRNSKTGNLIKPRSGKTSPYLLVGIKVNKKNTNFLVHRLVAVAFIPNPENKPQVNHKDGNKLNNHVSNLEWVTEKENMAHAFALGLYKKHNNQFYKGKYGKDHNRSIMIKCNGIIYNGLSEASRLTGVPISSIGLSIKQNKALKSGMHFQLAVI